MYCPPGFAVSDGERLRALIAAHPLATLITTGADGPCANLIPFQIAKGGASIRAHLARANPQLDHLREGQVALAVFHGPGAYVSPDWYASKAEHGRVVPTWNYLTVQVRGQAVVHEDADWLRDQVNALTDAHEAGRAQPWAVSDAPERYIAAQLRGIVGITLPLDDMRGKFKASQNRDAADRAGVARGLADTHPELSKATGAT
ncbi:MAG: FMN-binding negative transcriptional regulator [Paracoccus sp. (in: a-proteobacteria)]|nr:FMN-binding negative transcriptional regulator [Paracoccus sp. (in: a-proteobacteria)]